MREVEIAIEQRQYLLLEELLRLGRANVAELLVPLVALDVQPERIALGVTSAATRLANRGILRR